jgi:hypothetical protein
VRRLIPIFLVIAGVAIGALGMWVFKDHSFIVPIFIRRARFDRLWP